MCWDKTLLFKVQSIISSASQAFVRGINRWPVDSPHKGPVTRKMFPFDDIIMSLDHGHPKMILYTLTWQDYKHAWVLHKMVGILHTTFSKAFLTEKFRNLISIPFKLVLSGRPPLIISLHLFRQRSGTRQALGHYITNDALHWHIYASPYFNELVDMIWSESNLSIAR